MFPRTSQFAALLLLFTLGVLLLSGCASEQKPPETPANAPAGAGGAAQQGSQFGKPSLN